jgi:thioredoxin-dependent peroxiredoxin
MQHPIAGSLGTVALLAVLLGGCAKGSAEPGAQADRAAPAPDAPLARGAAVPSVTFALSDGERLSLASLRGKPVVVYFYPKDDTPGCTVEAQEIRDLHDELKGTGAVVIGVSTDAAESHQAFAQKHALPFALASDPSGEVAKAFGVPMKNGRVTRVSFVIDAEGRVKQAFTQVTPKGHAAELLTAIKS